MRIRISGACVLATLLLAGTAHAQDKDRPAATSLDALHDHQPLQETLDDGALVVRDAENVFSLRLGMFAQARYTYTGSGSGLQTQNFDLALGRISLSGTAVTPRLSYFFQFEGSTLGNSNRLSFLDGWLAYQFSPEANVQAGRFLLPYSRQFYTHPGNLLFPDLSAADYAFNLPRSTGFQFSGKHSRTSYSLAAVNSVRALDGLGQQNQGGSVAGVGRIEVDVLSPYGYLESSPTPVEAPQFSIGIAGAYNPVREGTLFQNLRPGDRTYNGTIDAGFRWKRLTLQAAGYGRQDRHPGELETTNDWGSYGQAGLYLVPRRWEVAARYSNVHFGQGPDAQNWRTAQEYTGGLNRYFYGHHLKVQSDFSVLRYGPSSISFERDYRFRLQLQFLL